MMKKRGVNVRPRAMQLQADSDDRDPFWKCLEQAARELAKREPDAVPLDVRWESGGKQSLAIIYVNDVNMRYVEVDLPFPGWRRQRAERGAIRDYLRQKSRLERIAG